MTTIRKLLTTTCVAAAALASAFTIGMGSASADEPKKFKIFLSLSYSGNAWQSEAANIVKALAQTPPYDQMVELKEVISGTDPQAQIAAYESMIDAKADGVISFPISSSALNRTVKNGCEKASCSSCTTRP